MSNLPTPEAAHGPIAPTGYAPAAGNTPAGLAITALIIGIVAFFSGWVPIWGIIAGAAAVSLGAIALRKRQNKALAITGLALGGLAALTSIITTLVMIAGLAAGPTSLSSTPLDSKTPGGSTAPSPEPKQSASPKPVEAAPSATPEPPAEPEKPALTISQSNAARSAQSYLEYAGFSRSGLIGQLEYEGYSTEDSAFAVDYVAPDWNAQAARSAKSYLDYSAFSRQGLIDQLIYEGFSAAEAEYGVTANGY